MRAHRNARRFFWAWLIGSAVVSTLGVVVHAQIGDANSTTIASAVAFFTVAIQLAATYGVHALAQAGLVGGAYRAALCIAVTLAALAFTVNFVQLRDLVITQAAIPTSLAWIVPIVVDLGMASSLIALFALTNAERSQQVHAHHVEPQQGADSAVHVEAHNSVHTEGRNDLLDKQIIQPKPAPDAHLAAAHRLVAQGIVRISPERVAKVLAEQSAGTAPSMIARRLSVGYSTVTKILENQPQEPR
ncbi:DUF2637 domain-containing protein [Mycolicibacter virginiensis]|uniref:DUF2637 domain-containing protein n=1 Tax=Mycolicibacter virginiensis TaxID=1795032 RepID=UPI001F040C4F|nr:DUF2637 domain-containing protein [Mycolicibacter virginiensis]ULP47337.1 DUF2637 domain-containing protein [Mycolicibacter virginiensis]